MNNKEYELISLEVEYPGIQGGCRWAVATDLSREELFQKYGEELEMYEPLLLINKEQAEVFKEYHRNDKKHEMREYRCHDHRGYIEGFEKGQRVVNQISRGLDMDDVLNAVYIKLAYNQLSNAQQLRVSLYFFCEMTEEEIAKLEGVSQVAVHKSIASAIKSMRFMLDLDNK